MEQRVQPSWAPKVAKCFLIPQRLVVAIMGACAVIAAYSTRIVLNIAITKIVIPPTAKNTTDLAICPLMEDSNNDTIDTSDRFDWDESLQGYILGSIYIGSVISHLPCGILADKYGAKYVLLAGIFVSGLVTLLTPLIIYNLGPGALIVSRILNGFGQGLLFPTVSALVSHWAPTQERTIFGAFVLGGGQVGSILCNSVSGLILYKYRWEWTFYIFGTLSLVWCVFFEFLCYSTPSKHPFITEKEFEYIKANTAGVSDRSTIDFPWKMIFTNIYVWAMIIGQQGYDWGFYMLLTNLPKYFNEVLQMKIHKTGFFAALPFLSMWLVSIIVATGNDVLINKYGVSRTLSRRVNGFLASIPPALFMIAASYAGCNHELALAFFVLSMSTMAFFYSSIGISPVDMGPNYAGTVNAITNGLGAITGIIVPIIVGAMAPNSTMMEWRRVFWITLGLKTVCGLVYTFKASADVQPYNDPPPKE